jgi:hypothetical protein
VLEERVLHPAHLRPAGSGQWRFTEAHHGIDVGTGSLVIDEPSRQRHENSTRHSHRRVIMITCQSHGSAGFTNLLVTKEDGVIVLNPHLANCCVLRLEEQAAATLHSILGEWLG